MDWTYETLTRRDDAAELDFVDPLAAELSAPARTLDVEALNEALTAAPVEEVRRQARVAANRPGSLQRAGRDDNMVARRLAPAVSMPLDRGEHMPRGFLWPPGVKQENDGRIRGAARQDILDTAQGF